MMSETVTACVTRSKAAVYASRGMIRGGSAGGFTVLAALVQADTFAAGASSYGVADLTALAEETHKFESRYLDGLVAPWPEGREVPLGWKAVGKAGPKQECLDYIEEVWTDMRPLSLRVRMGDTRI